MISRPTSKRSSKDRSTSCQSRQEIVRSGCPPFISHMTIRTFWKHSWIEGRNWPISGRNPERRHGALHEKVLGLLPPVRLQIGRRLQKDGPRHSSDRLPKLSLLHVPHLLSLVFCRAQLRLLGLHDNHNIRFHVPGDFPASGVAQLEREGSQRESGI